MTEKIKIQSVIVKYRNGQTEDQAELAGLYRVGEAQISYMPSKPVSSVTVVAQPASVLRSKGAFQLDAAALRTKSSSEFEDEEEDSAQYYEFEDAAEDNY